EPVEEDMNLTIQSPLESSETVESVEDGAMEVPETWFEAEPSEETEEEAFTVPDTGEDHTQPPVEEMTAISEEKIEAIVARVVGDVVEKVARETMAEVAEKVINEAIDALKQSLDKNSN
ncbi:hypothetical protein OAC89_05445, partial [Deltaproteobacteria bacterium]|nr:hypothetical protein [Deltaproteobacteria bacterium]